MTEWQIRQGDVREVLAGMDDQLMHNNKGRFVKGTHWRNPKPYWDRDWLFDAYVTRGQSAQEIANQFDCHENNILYFLHKLGIATRTISETRAIKYWGTSGPANPMYGKTGADNPHWKGGITADRQAFYCSREWAEAVRAVWRRDRGICQRCAGKTKASKGVMHIHHLVPFECVELRCDAGNLVLLCRECHHWVHSRENTEQHYIWEVPTSGVA